MRLGVELPIALARAWPARWLALLNPLPGGGLMDACGLWHGFEAANDPTA